MTQARECVINVHDRVNEWIQKRKNPHPRNAGNRHRPQTDDRTGVMESLQEARRFALQQQNDCVKQFIVFANVKQPNQVIDSTVKVF